VHSLGSRAPQVRGAHYSNKKVYDKTPYTLIQRDGKLRNAPSNQMEMSPELVDAVIAAAFA